MHILDVPEAALSESQFIIATHSPILLAYPNAKILLLNLNGYLPVNYEDTEHYQLTRRVPNETDEALKDVSLTCEVTHPLPHGRGSVRCSDFSASTHSMAY